MSSTLPICLFFFFFFFNDTATTEIYTLSLHDALPISAELFRVHLLARLEVVAELLLELLGKPLVEHLQRHFPVVQEDRKSTRLNSSHSQISYAVFCLKKKKNHIIYRQVYIIVSTNNSL